MVFLFNYLQPTKSSYIEPVQGSNLNRRYIAGLEPEMPVAKSVTGICYLYFSHLQGITAVHINHMNVGLPIPNTNFLYAKLIGLFRSVTSHYLPETDNHFHLLSSYYSKSSWCVYL